MMVKALAGRRRGGTARVPLEQLHAQLVLQHLDAARQRRLADRNVLGCSGQVPVLEYRDEILELA